MIVPFVAKCHGQSRQNTMPLRITQSQINYSSPKKFMSCSTDEPEGKFMSKRACKFMHTLAIIQQASSSPLYIRYMCVSAEGWEKIQILWGMNDLRPEL